ncbi:MAG: hypothetical protein PVF70_13195, partial [Anaerolineales bacterium]
MRSRRRPWWIICVSLGLLAFSSLFLLRLAEALQTIPLPSVVPPWYFPLTGAIWGLGSLAAAVGLFLGWAWARPATLWGAGAFGLWYWADRLLLVQTDYAKRSWPSAAVLTLFFMTGLLWILNLPASRRFFRK